MAISKGRNELQASIEDWGTILESLAIDINSYYQGKITNIEDDIKRFKENNYNENFEEIKSIIDTQIQEIGIYKEFQRGALEMLVVKIYSYAERHFEILLSRVKRRTASKRCFRY